MLNDFTIKTNLIKLEDLQDILEMLDDFTSFNFDKVEKIIFNNHIIQLNHTDKTIIITKDIKENI